MGYIVLYIILISLVIHFKEALEKREREINQLKKTIAELQNQQIQNAEVTTPKVADTEAKVEVVKRYCTVCGKEIMTDSKYCTECESKIEELRKQEEARREEERRIDVAAAKQRREKIEEERKNSLILTIGSFLIVLAAVTFLMGTWNTIHDIFKTIVLALGIALFLGGSKIAETRLKITKTARTFFFIAMAYIPLFLLSLSIFGLLGDYLSITGEGRYLYLGFSSIITAIVYYGFYKSKNEKSLFLGSLLAQAGAVVLLSLMISSTLELVLINLLLYNIVLIVVLGMKEDPIIFDDMFSIIPFISSFLSISLIFEESGLIALVFLLLAVNFGILYKKYKFNQIIPFFFIGSVFVCGLYTILQLGDGLGTQLQYTISLAYLFATYLIINFTTRNEKNLKSIIYILFMAFDFILFLSMFMYTESERIPLFTFTLVGAATTILSHKMVPKYMEDIMDLILPILFLVTGILIIDKLNMIIDISTSAFIHIYMIYALAFFVSGELIYLNKNVQIKKVWFIISNVFIGIVFAVSILPNVYEIGSYAVELLFLTLIYIYDFYKYKQQIFKYIAYVSFIILSYSLSDIISKTGLELYYYIPTIVSVILILLEEKYSKLKDEYSFIFSDILKVIAYFNLYRVTGMSTPVGCVYSIFLIVMNRKYANTQRMYDDVIPLIGIVPVILNNVALTREMIIGLLSVAVVTLTIYSITQRRISIYTIASCGYLMILGNYLEITMLFKIIFIIWAFVLWYFFTDEKQKDILKFLGVLGILGLYIDLIKEMDLNGIILFNYAGIIITDIFIMRNILCKYIKDFEILEAISLVVLYLIPISQYADELDGMIFVAFIVAILVFSYVKKYGMTFMVSGAAIILNALLLTREFWLSVPWWLYMMIVGGFLIGFAGTNEARQNKGINITSKIKDFKERIDGKE